MTYNPAPAEERVSLVVDSDVCIGIGRCEMLEPDAFSVSDEAIAQVDPATTFTRSRADEIVLECPSGAISILAGE
ncbi:MAG: (4Fe-4S)-binding protein [Acidimicrobiales bacterium]